MNKNQKPQPKSSKPAQKQLDLKPKFKPGFGPRGFNPSTFKTQHKG